MERNSCRTMMSGGQWPVASGWRPGSSAKGTHWRRAKRTRESSFSHRAPPSARQLELAEWVEFPERNARFDHSAAPFGGEGSPGRGGTGIREGEAPAEPPHPRQARREPTIWALGWGGPVAARHPAIRKESLAVWA
jgi:hypothetical protein